MGEDGDVGVVLKGYSDGHNERRSLKQEALLAQYD